MDRYKVEQYDGDWYLIDTLQQRLLVGPETFTICDQLLERLNGRAIAPADEYTEIEEVAGIIAQAS